MRFTHVIKGQDGGGEGSQLLRIRLAIDSFQFGFYNGMVLGGPSWLVNTMFHEMTAQTLTSLN
jgi:hypothetical protein